MKILAAVPTYKRPYIFEKRAWYYLKNLKNCDVKVFCDKKEYKYYKQVAGDCVVVGADQGKPNGLISQLNFIGNYAVKNNYDVVWKVDDKLTLHKSSIKKKDIVRHIDQYLVSIKKQFNLGADAIGTCKAREYLHSSKKGFSPRYKPFDASYFVRSNYLSLDEKVFSMDELQLYLKLAVLNKLNVFTCYEIYIDNPMGKYKGGLQLFDRLKESKASISQLFKTYPEIKYKDSRSETNIDIGLAIDYIYYRNIYKNHFLTNL